MKDDGAALRSGSALYLAFAAGAWGWVACVAFVFGAVEAQWLMSQDRGYIVIGFGILIADLASATIYWSGWSLRRLIITIAVSVPLAAICAIITASGKMTAFASTGILAASILVHSGAMCLWFSDRLVSRIWPSMMRPFKRLELVGALLCWLLGSLAVSHWHMAYIFTSQIPLAVSSQVALFIHALIGGGLFWVLFRCLSGRIGKRGNEELRHHLENFVQAVLDSEPAPAKNGNKMRVFVSYVRENLEDVRRIVVFLQGEGFEVFWDQELKPGQNWREELTNEIRNAAAVLVCFSRESEQREESELYAEIRTIIDKVRSFRAGAIFFIPVRLSACKLPIMRIDSTTTLDSIQRVDLFPDSRWNNGLQEITASLRSKQGR